MQAGYWDCDVQCSPRRAAEISRWIKAAAGGAALPSGIVYQKEIYVDTGNITDDIITNLGIRNNFVYHTLYEVIRAWNSWFDTLIYASGKVNLHTLQYKLMEYLQSSQAQARGSGEVGAMALSKTSNIVTPVSIRAAITVIAAMPIILIYPFMQRYFVIVV